MEETASPLNESVIDEAKRIINGARKDQYGGAEDNFQRIADLWSAYLTGKYQAPAGLVTPVDVALLMALMKIARLEHTPDHRDSVVDVIGYLGCVEKIWEGR